MISINKILFSYLYSSHEVSRIYFESLYFECRKKTDSCRVGHPILLPTLVPEETIPLKGIAPATNRKVRRVC